MQPAVESLAAIHRAVIVERCLAEALPETPHAGAGATDVAAARRALAAGLRSAKALEKHVDACLRAIKDLDAADAGIAVAAAARDVTERLVHQRLPAS